MTGYNLSVPLARGEDRTTERVGEGEDQTAARVGEGEERRGGREKRWLFAAMLASASLDPSIYELRTTRVIKK